MDDHFLTADDGLLHHQFEATEFFPSVLYRTLRRVEEMGERGG